MRLPLETACGESGARGDRFYPRFWVASGLATSRAVWMKSCAAGLMVRFFNVMTPTGIGGTASLIGNPWIECRSAPNRMSEPGNMVKNFSVTIRPSCRCTEIAATVYHALGVDPRTSLPGPDGRPQPLVEASPVPELFG